MLKTPLSFRLDSALLAQARTYCAAHCMTLTQLITAAILRYIRKERP